MIYDFVQLSLQPLRARCSTRLGGGVGPALEASNWPQLFLFVSVPMFVWKLAHHLLHM